MSETELIGNLLEQISAMDGGIAAETSEADYHKLSSALGELGDALRERIQHKTSAQMQDVIDKLEAGSSLNGDDSDLIRLWMVSDAEFYVQLQEDYGDWLVELDRLISNITSLKDRELDAEVYGKLSGCIRDALRVTADIVHFKRQEDRVRRFESSMEALTVDDKLKLAEMLRHKLDSDSF